MTYFSPKIEDLISAPVDFTGFVNELPIGVMILDRDCRIVHTNRHFEALTGYSSSDSRGMPCHSILRSSACIKSCPAKEIQSGRTISIKSDIINTGRERIPVQVTIAQIYDENGDVKGYVETVSDLRGSSKDEAKQEFAYSFANIIGRSSQMERIFQTLPVLAQSDVSVLITGETGTGKDLVAEAMHQNSERAQGPFIKINCGALPETLLESELFGHTKGAFTGAVENKPGRFRLAHNGTIFLTEIGDLPLSLQVKLLTFLDDKVIYPLGSNTGFKANVRMITATHRDLEQMVREKRFRKDLLFRLNVARIHLPPLREREGDVRLFIDYFFNIYKKKLGVNARGFSKEVLQLLLNYHYEGNIRELKNIIEYAVSIVNGPFVEISHLPSYLTDRSHEFSLLTEELSDESADIKRTKEGKATYTKSQKWSDTEKGMILDALVQCRGKKNEAAKLLGWGRSTLWRKMKQYHLN